MVAAQHRPITLWTAMAFVGVVMLAGGCVAMLIGYMVTDMAPPDVRLVKTVNSENQGSKVLNGNSEVLKNNANKERDGRIRAESALRESEEKFRRLQVRIFLYPIARIGYSCSFFYRKR